MSASVATRPLLACLELFQASHMPRLARPVHRTAATIAVLLHGRARNVAIGAEHAAVSRLWRQPRAASGADMHDDAGVLGHVEHFRARAVRTGEGRLEVQIRLFVRLIRIWSGGCSRPRRNHCRTDRCKMRWVGAHHLRISAHISRQRSLHLPGKLQNRRRESRYELASSVAHIDELRRFPRPVCFQPISRSIRFGSFHI